MNTRRIITQRRIILVGLGLIVAGTAGVTWAGWPVGEASEGSTPAADVSTLGVARSLPVAVVEVVPATGFDSVRRHTGMVEATRESALGFQRSGELEVIHVAEGAVVEAGQPLAELDARRLRAQRRQVQAELDVAAAILAELETGPRAEVIAAARARVDAARALAERRAVRRGRVESAHADGATNEAELDDAIFDHDVATALLNEAQESLRELESGTRSEQLLAQQARVTSLEARRDQIDVDLDESVLRAPFDGRVDRRLVDEGRTLAVGEPVLRVIESAALEAWIGVPVDAIGALPPGSVQTLIVDGAEVSARVRNAMPDLDRATRTARVVMDILDETAALPGQIARLERRERIDEAGTWLPLAALSEGRRGLWRVFVAVPLPSDPERAEVRVADVELIQSEADRVFVRGPLDAGELVIARGGHRVVPGQVVRVER